MVMTLDGINVLDLSQQIDGPYCAKLLADYGADVIKIEAPSTGDPARRSRPFPQDLPHPEKSGLFLFLNTNKRGITLNLETAKGRRLFKRLVGQADLVVENFGPGVMDRMGLGVEELHGINPRLVVTSISNFGSWGPYRDYKATDIVTFAAAGYMSQMGDPDKPPLQPGVPVNRFITGLYAAFGSLMALFGAQLSGQGQRVEISEHEALASVLIYDTVAYSYSGRIKKRPGHSWATHHGIRSSIQPCQDGFVGFLVGGERERWQLLWEVLIGMPEVAEDPRLETLEGQVEHTPELEERARPWLMEHTSQEIFHMAQELRLPFADILDTSEILQSPHLRERGYFQSLDHPAAGRLEYPGFPFRMGATPARNRHAAPLLGQHNSEIYSGLLGLDRQELVRLRNVGVI